MTQQRLNRLAQATSVDVRGWKEGVSIERDAGVTISQLLYEAASQRWRLASRFHLQANRLLRMRPAQYRGSISRYYYCMYHAMRACVFVETEGDDHEAHSELPLHIPSSFDPNTNWQNKLKNARLIRNRADYEVYPKSESAWRQSATQLGGDAGLLLKSARAFLKSKGCAL